MAAHGYLKTVDSAGRRTHTGDLEAGQTMTLGLKQRVEAGAKARGCKTLLEAAKCGTPPPPRAQARRSPTATLGGLSTASSRTGLLRSRAVHLNEVKIQSPCIGAQSRQLFWTESTVADSSWTSTARSEMSPSIVSSRSAIRSPGSSSRTSSASCSIASVTSVICMSTIII